jgi:hypothetical protein
LLDVADFEGDVVEADGTGFTGFGRAILRKQVLVVAIGLPASRALR